MYYRILKINNTILSHIFNVKIVRNFFKRVFQEIGEAMLDLKLGIEELRKSKCLRQILASILSVGNFLNGSEVR